jgi:hypothetical protein
MTVLSSTRARFILLFRGGVQRLIPLEGIIIRARRAVHRRIDVEPIHPLGEHFGARHLLSRTIG